MVKHYTASQFTPTQWAAAEEKANFANHFRRFVESGFKETLFYDWFYQRLSMTFGHIAHYNRQGFYSTFFESVTGCVMFLRQCSQYGCYGDATHTYSDVEKALMPFILETLPQCEKVAMEAIEAAERAEMDRLTKKYGRN